MNGFNIGHYGMSAAGIQGAMALGNPSQHGGSHLRPQHAEPDSEHFFLTAKRAGGPVYPHSVFKEIYNEIYLEKKEEGKEEQAELNNHAGDSDNELDALKQTEYKSHPLYPILLQFSEDLRDYIEEKRTQYLQAQSLDRQHSFGAMNRSHHWIDAQPDINSFFGNAQSSRVSYAGNPFYNRFYNYAQGHLSSAHPSAVFPQDPASALSMNGGNSLGMKGPSYMMGAGGGFGGLPQQIMMSDQQQQQSVAANLPGLDLNAKIAVSKGYVSFSKPNLVPKTIMVPTVPPQHI